jgi:UBX domain
MAAAIAASLAEEQRSSQDFTFSQGGRGGREAEPVPGDLCQNKRVCTGTDAGPSNAGGAQHIPETLIDESAGVCEVAVKTPSSQRLMAKFGMAQPVADIARWVEAHGWDMQVHRLALSYPKRALDDTGATLKEAGLQGPREMMILEPAPR